MDKEKILSRLNSKDYNNELETILEEKHFSENVKNLLLSMLYKIEAGYTDYIEVKRMVENRKNYIEEILIIIKEKAKEIRIVEEDSEIGKELKETGKKYKIQKLEKAIDIMYPNEKNLLYALYELDDRQVYLDEKYNLIRNSLSELLNMGENINNTEVLRDFNGWSWDTTVSEIPDIGVNLIYQNLIYVLGIEFIKDWVHTNEIKDYVQLVEQKLTQSYGQKNVNRLLELLYSLSILICTDKNEREKERLLEEKEQLEKELARLTDKTALLNEISTMKKETLKKIKEIDSILNDKKLLEQEYIKRNEKLPEYNKIFSLSHLTEILTRQRRKLLVSMEEANRILDPSSYVKSKQNLEKELEIVANIQLGGEEKQKKQQQEVVELQKVFLDCMEMKIKQIVDKEDIIDVIYILRYYNFLPIDANKVIGQVKELEKKRIKLQEELIQKGQKMKIITKLSDSGKVDEIIWKNIFTMRLINLEHINLELVWQDETVQVGIYDIDILEDTIEIDSIIDKKDSLVKSNKKVKLLS